MLRCFLSNLEQRVPT